MLLENFSNYNIEPDGTVTNVRFAKQLKPYFDDTTGYLKLTITSDRKTRHKVYLHRLLALTFIPNPQNLPQVNHKDGDKLNNDLSNLEWVSRQYNVQHGYDLGLSAKLDKRYNNVNPVESIHSVCSLLAEGILNCVEISKITGVSDDSVREIKYRKQWKDISSLYVW